MKFLVLLFASLGLLVSSVGGYTTYISTSGSELSITHAENGSLYSTDLFIGPNSNFSDSNNLTFANISNADLVNSYSDGMQFNVSNFSGVDFSNSTHINADFFRVNLTNANFTNTNLSGVSRGVSFGKTILDGAVFTGATLLNVEFQPVTAIGADFRFTDLSQVTYFNIDNPDGVVAADALLGAYFYGAILPSDRDQEWFEARGADFTTVPEPSSCALLIGSLALGLVALRRR